MRRFIVTLVTVFSMCCLIACGGEKASDASTGGNNDESVVTEAPTVEPEVTPEPADATPEPTVEPTVEPTADPVVELISLRDEAIAEQDAIEEVMQAQIDLVAPLLEVVKTLPDFVETADYTNIPLASSDLESSFLEGDINDVILFYNFLIYCINQLIIDYPELTGTEEFQNLLNAPTFNTLMYNTKVAIYNSALANTETSGFEELPYPIIKASSIEY